MLKVEQTINNQSKKCLINEVCWFISQLTITNWGWNIVQVLCPMFLSPLHYFEHFALQSSINWANWVITVDVWKKKISNSSWFWFENLYKHVKKHFSLSKKVSVTKFFCRMLRSFLLINGKCSFKQKHIPPHCC